MSKLGTINLGTIGLGTYDYDMATHSIIVNSGSTTEINEPITTQIMTAAESFLDNLLRENRFELTAAEKARQEKKHNQDEAKKFNERAQRLYGNCKVIVNNPAVILQVGDKKYISVAAEGEEFDAEKGLMLCILKWKGATFTDIERLLSKAKVFKK